MRIIGGTHKSRQFHILNNSGIRPTTDFAKEALFNILQHRIDFENMTVLDLFSGSGSISYEFASRGCKHITSIEKNPNCCNFIKKKSQEFGFENIRVVSMDVFKFLNLCTDTFNIIFADPPFKLQNIERIPALVFEKNLITENGMLIVEHSTEINFSEIKQLTETRNYGTVNFSIFLL
ncbi:MAG: 16S rRNA (guanine(966)-N(2))-methyltransferase RsmD [Bacteroidota bacterium]